MPPSPTSCSVAAAGPCARQAQASARSRKQRGGSCSASGRSRASPQRPKQRSRSCGLERAGRSGALQQALNGAGAMPPLRADGDFGPATVRATRDFQTGARLPQTAAWWDPHTGGPRKQRRRRRPSGSPKTGLRRYSYASPRNPNRPRAPPGQRRDTRRRRECCRPESRRSPRSARRPLERMGQSLTRWSEMSFVEDPVGYAEQKVSEAAP